MNPKPKVSIITVTYNAENFLEKTIQSVLTQTYENIEYIIIDGGSKDGTLDLIKKYEGSIDFWKSEKDEGLYDAMNKGIKYSTGEYLWFMNAGDEIYAKDTLEKNFEKSNKADIYYGETKYYDLQGKYLGLRSEETPHKLPERLSWKSMAYGMVVCHQAIIVKKDIAVAYKHQKYPFSADIDWVIEVLKRAKTIINTQEVLAKYLQGGFSRKHLKSSLTDRFSILRYHFGVLPTLFRHVWILLRGVIFIFKRKKTY